MNDLNGILWRRFLYFLTPQFDLYESLAPKLAGKNVLEIGFGTGLGTLQLAEFAETITAIEIERDAVKFAKRVFPLPNLDWRWGDVVKLRQNPKVDAVVMIEVLEHITDCAIALRNVEQALKTGGEFYLTHRNANADLRRNDAHEREWSAEQLVEALSTCFDDVSLWDYSLTRPQDEDTRLTPLVAVARKGY